MLKRPTIRIGQRPRIEGLVLAYGVDERRAISGIIVERDWDQGEHEMLQVVKKVCSGRLAEIAHGTIRVTKHAAIRRLGIVWAQMVQVGALRSR